jgi:predicted nucleic acid-binding protein
VIVYVETSAAAKVIFDEPDSLALQQQLDDLVAGEVPLFSSAILETELRRAATREGTAQHLVTQALDRFNVIELDQSVFRTAGLLPGQHLRSLDALHIAAALRVGADVMVSYDQRQIEAAREVGLHTLSPS